MYGEWNRARIRKLEDWYKGRLERWFNRIWEDWIHGHFEWDTNQDPW